MKKFDEHPFIAIWETTQACDLACRHCRAQARPERDAGELSTAEARGLIDSLAAGNVRLMVLTGGDPAKREDLVELVSYGRSQGLTMGLTPSATPLVTEALIEQLAAAGLSRLAISIDGPEPGMHDRFRGVPGSFAHSLRILEKAKACGITTQVNTSVHAGNIDALTQMVPLIHEIGCTLWSVFYIVPTGRAGRGMMPSTEAVERSLEWLADVADTASFSIKTTAAPQYRRILLARKSADRHATRGLDTLRVNEGRGFMFISHRGDFFPSGFLPIACGNLRTEDPIEAYRNHPLFRALRDPSELHGKCGACQYRAVCGGSRARAFATSNDPLGSDPLCAYVPPGWVDEQPRAPRRHLGVIDG